MIFEIEDNKLLKIKIEEADYTRLEQETPFVEEINKAQATNHTYTETSFTPQIRMGKYIIEIPEGIEEIAPRTFEMLGSIIEEIKLPSTLKVIGDNAFNGLFDIENIDFPEGLEVIGARAFKNCEHLQSVILPESVKEIGEGAFKECYAVREIKLPSTLEVVPKEAFTDCHAKKITLPKTIREVGESAFGGAVDQETLELPNTLEKIGKGAFCNNELLTEVTLPAGLTEIEDNVFYRTGLKKIDIPEKIVKIGDEAFCATEITEINLPPNIQSMGKGVFKRCQKLKSISFPQNEDFREIPESSCLGCESIKRVTIPEGIEKIGKAAFTNCNSLEKIDLPATLKEIDACAFELAEILRELNLPQSCVKIGESAFKDCKLIKEVRFPDEMQSIGNTVFMDCVNLRHVVLPSVLENMGDGIFTRCENLWAVKLPETIEELPNSTFKGCKSLESIKIPPAIKEIGFKCFSETNIHEIEIPNGCTTIEGMAFTDTPLKEIVLPKTIAYIGHHAFQNTDIESFTVPPQIMDLGEGLFKESKIKEIYMHDEVHTIGKDCFEDCTNLQKVQLSKNLREIGWSAFNGCHGLKDIDLANTTVQIIAGGAFQKCISLNNIVFPSTCIHIGNNAFSESGISSAKFNVNKGAAYFLDFGAFQKCYKLKEIDISELKISTLEKNIFADCSKLQTVKLPYTLKIMGNTLFKNCEALTEINLPEGIKELPDGCFLGCTSLKNVNVAGQIKKVGAEAFSGCSSLEEIDLSNVEHIKKLAFQDCGIKDISIDNIDVKGEGTSFIGYNGKVHVKGMDITLLLKYADGLELDKLVMLAQAMRFDNLKISNHSARYFCNFMHKNTGNLPTTLEIEEYRVTGGHGAFKGEINEEKKERLKEAFKNEFGRVPRLLGDITRLINIGYDENTIVQGFNVKRFKNAIENGEPICPSCVKIMEMTKNEQAYVEKYEIEDEIVELLIKGQNEKVTEGSLNTHNSAKWLIRHPFVSKSLVEDITEISQELVIKENDTTQDVRDKINAIGTFTEMAKLEKRYDFKFDECQFDLRYSSAEINGYKASIMEAGDARMATIGYDTSCCQHLDGAGETAMMHGLLHPNAGFWIIENSEHKVIAQAEIWEQGKDILVFDNIEFADDRSLENVIQPLTKWLAETEYKEVVMGTSYTESSIELHSGGARLPELTEEELIKFDDEENNSSTILDGYDVTDYVYTDAEEGTEILKQDGNIAKEIVKLFMEETVERMNNSTEGEISNIIEELPEFAKEYIAIYLDNGEKSWEDYEDGIKDAEPVEDYDDIEW